MGLKNVVNAETPESEDVPKKIKIVKTKSLEATEKTGLGILQSDTIGIIDNVTQTIRATARSIVFFLKILPMLPSKPVDWVTSRPVRERVTFATPFGKGAGDLYHPSRPGTYPGIAVCLGVVPFGFDHPQIPRLGSALAQSDFAALLYQSPLMQDFCLDPQDVGNFAAAYHYLIEQPFVRSERSGVLGTCVGGSFALLSAAHPTIRDRVAFVAAFAPYASMHNLALGIASSTRLYDGQSEPWLVDQLTRKVFVHSLTAMLENREGDRLRSLLEKQSDNGDILGLSADSEAVRALLTATKPDDALEALNRLPAAMLDRMAAISPVLHIEDIHAPLVLLGHDRDDLVIPAGESRSLVSAWPNRRGLHYTEFGMFQHADPTKRKLPPHRLAREFGKFYSYVYPLFREAVR